MSSMAAFSARDAYQQGKTQYDLTRLVDDKAVVRVSRGAYAGTADARGLRGRAEALCRVIPNHAVICRRAAAWLWGLDVLPPGVGEAQWLVEVVVPAGTTPTRRRVCRAYQADLSSDDVVHLAGVRVTSRERTALDCARYAPRLEAVAALDQFLRHGVDLAKLQERAAALAGRRNVALLRAVLEVADAGAESPGESWVRVLIVDAGLPRPATQVHVQLSDHRSAYLDMGVEAYRTGIEYDGEEHHTGTANERHDAERRRQLDAAGWRTVVVRKEHVLKDPRPFLRRVAEAYLDGGWNPSPEKLDEVLRHIAYLAHHRASNGHSRTPCW